MKELWGVYDTQSRLWIGNIRGPFKFKDRRQAQVALQVATERLVGCHPTGHFTVRAITGLRFRAKDAVKLCHSPLPALQRIKGERMKSTSYVWLPPADTQ